MYLGYETKTGRKVVIKILSLKEAGKKAFQENIILNLERLKELKHPGLIDILDFGVLFDSFFLVMDYVEGQSLKKVLQEVGDISIKLSLEIMQQALSILVFFHKRGFFHLGLKSSKIFLTAKTLSASQFVKLDPVGYFMPLFLEENTRKNPYLAPEFFQTQSMDHRSDIYSLGVIFYEMLTGILPFPTGLLQERASLQVPPITRLKANLKIPVKLEKAILKAIQWDPALRFSDMQEFTIAILNSGKGSLIELFHGWAVAVCIVLLVLCFSIIHTWDLGKKNLKTEEIKPKSILQKEPLKHSGIFSMEAWEEAQKKLKILSHTSLDTMCYVEGGNIVLQGNQYHIKPFYMDQTEVMNIQYQIFINSTGNETPRNWFKGKYPQGKSNYPVTYVNWYNASLYALWQGKKLPSESQWARAAYKGTNSLWPWGNTFSKKYANIQGKELKKVAQFPKGKSPYEIMDMAGNVWEWCEDWYDDEVKQDRVIRGGSYRSYIEKNIGMYKDGFPPEADRDDIGFRCVKEVEKNE